MAATDSEDSPCLVVVGVFEGRNFPRRPQHRLLVEAQFHGERLSSEGVWHEPKPLFYTELAWEMTRTSLHQHKLKRTPVKLACFAVDTMSNRRESIGYFMLDLRAVQSSVSTEPRWYTLQSCKYAQSKAQLRVVMDMEVDGERGVRPRIADVGEHTKPNGKHRARARKPTTSKKENRRSTAMATQIAAPALQAAGQPGLHDAEKQVPPLHISPATLSSVLDEDEGCFVIPPLNEQEHVEVFLLSLTLSSACNLAQLVSHSQTSLPSYHFYFSLLGNDITMETFSSLVRCDFKAERATVRLRSSFQTLAIYLAAQKPIMIHLCCGKQSLGCAVIELAPLLSYDSAALNSRRISLSQSCVLHSLDQAVTSLSEEQKPAVDIALSLAPELESLETATSQGTDYLALASHSSTSLTGGSTASLLEPVQPAADATGLPAAGRHGDAADATGLPAAGRRGDAADRASHAPVPQLPRLGVDTETAGGTPSHPGRTAAAIATGGVSPMLSRGSDLSSVSQSSLSSQASQPESVPVAEPAGGVAASLAEGLPSQAPAPMHSSPSTRNAGQPSSPMVGSRAAGDRHFAGALQPAGEGHLAAPPATTTTAGSSSVVSTSPPLLPTTTVSMAPPLSLANSETRRMTHAVPSRPTPTVAMVTDLEPPFQPVAPSAGSKFLHAVTSPVRSPAPVRPPSSGDDIINWLADQRPHHFTVAIDLRSVRDVLVGHIPDPALQLRYCNPFFSSTCPITTDPPLRITGARESEEYFPRKSFCTFDFAAQPSQFNMQCSSSPILVEAWHCVDGVARKLLGTTRLYLREAMQQPRETAEEDGDGGTGWRRVYSAEHDVLSLDSPASRVFRLCASVSIQDHGPVILEIMRQGLDENAPPLEQSVPGRISPTPSTETVVLSRRPAAPLTHPAPATAATPTDVTDRDSAAYQAALQLELWKAAEEERFREALEVRKKQQLQLLAEEWKRRDLEREISVNRKIEEYEKLELQLRTALVNVEQKEALLRVSQQETTSLRASLEAQKDRLAAELRDTTERLQDTFRHQLELERSRTQEADSQRVQVQQQLAELQHAVRQRDGELLACRADRNSQPEVKLQAEMSIAQMEKAELSRKLESCQRSKLHYKEQWAKALRELARYRQEQQRSEQERLKEQRRELDHMRLRYLAHEEKSVLKEDGDRGVDVAHLETQLQKSSPHTTAAPISAPVPADNAATAGQPGDRHGVAAAAAITTNSAADSSVHHASTGTTTSGKSPVRPPRAQAHPARVVQTTYMDDAVSVSSSTASRDEHLSHLIGERDTLLRTGVYTHDDHVIKELDRQIRHLMANA